MEYKVKVHTKSKRQYCAKISVTKIVWTNRVCIMHYHLYFCRSFADESRNYLIDFIESSCRDHMFAAWRNTGKKLHGDTRQWIESRRSWKRERARYEEASRMKSIHRASRRHLWTRFHRISSRLDIRWMVLEKSNEEVERYFFLSFFFFFANTIIMM